MLTKEDLYYLELDQQIEKKAEEIHDKYIDITHQAAEWLSDEYGVHYEDTLNQLIDELVRLREEL